MNNLVNIANNDLTMSSREIAELTGKRHDHVKRDIEKMLSDLGEDIPKFGGIYFDGMNRKQTEYLLDEDFTLCLTSGYSVQQRMAIIRRWKELESKQPQLPDFSNPVEAARAWADAIESEQQAKQELALNAPAIDFAKRITGAKKGVKLGNFAKTIGLGPRKIFQVLRDMHVLMSCAGDRYNLPFQKYINLGYFTVCQRTFETNSEPRISHTALITGKGERWLTKRLLDAGLLKVEAA